MSGFASAFRATACCTPRRTAEKQPLVNNLLLLASSGTGTPPQHSWSYSTCPWAPAALRCRLCAWCAGQWGDSVVTRTKATRRAAPRHPWTPQEHNHQRGPTHPRHSRGFAAPRSSYSVAVVHSERTLQPLHLNGMVLLVRPVDNWLCGNLHVQSWPSLQAPDVRGRCHILHAASPVMGQRSQGTPSCNRTSRIRPSV